MFIDSLFFEFLHLLCRLGGFFFTPFFRFITLLGEKGWIFLFAACILSLRKKTRWVGATIIASIFFSFITADIILKPIIARPRPYLSDMVNIYKYWVDTGSIKENGFSFPSGHTLAAAAFLFSLYITVSNQYRKKILMPCIIMLVLMVMARCYFMHHYLTDCLGSVAIAFFLCYIGKFVVKIIYSMCKKYENIPLFNFALNFDFFELFAPKR